MGMKIVQVSNNNYDSLEETSQKFSPLHFGYYELQNLGYNITLLYPQKLKGIWVILRKVLGRHILDINLQYRCIKASKNADLIYYPIDRHCLALALFRKWKMIKCPVVMLCHFSFNPRYIISNKSKIYKRLERKYVFKYIDKVIFPCEKLREIAMDAYITDKDFGVVHWGATPEWYEAYRVPSSKCDYYMGCGGTNRDYKTLIEAVNNTKIRVKIYTSSEQVKKLAALNPTENIELIAAVGTNRKEILRKGYGEAKAVLIPINLINDVPNGATVLVESLAVGKPVVISDINTNFIDVEAEKVGFKVKLHDVEDWKCVLNTLEKKPQLLDEYGHNAFMLAKNKFNSEKMAKELSYYFEEMKNNK